MIKDEEGENKDKSNTQRIRRCKKIFRVTERKERRSIFHLVQLCKAMLFQKVILKRGKHEKKKRSFKEKNEMNSGNCHRNIHKLKFRLQSVTTVIQTHICWQLHFH